MWQSKTGFDSMAMDLIETGSLADLLRMVTTPHNNSSVKLRVCAELFLNGGQGRLVKVLYDPAGALMLQLIVDTAKQAHTQEGQYAQQILAWLVQRGVKPPKRL